MELKRDRNGAKADVCIVGGGAAGITLALELANSDLQVILLEGGSMDPLPQSRAAYRVLPGEPMSLGLDETKLSRFGGNTNYWFGNCRPLDPEDFEPRDWLPFSGWPIGLEELKPYYRRAQRLCGLGDYAWYDIESCVPRLRHRPLDLSPGVLQTRLTQTTPSFSFADLYRDELKAANNLRLVLGARATRLVTSASGDRVIAVEIAGTDGFPSTIEAKTFIIASGGVENARLLLCSSDGVAGGLGNDNDLVGRFFMEHLFFAFTPEQSGSSKRTRHRDLGLYNGGIGDRQAQLKTRQPVADARVWGQLILSHELMRTERLPGLSLWFRPDKRMPPSLLAAKRLLSKLRHGRLFDLTVSDLREALADPARTVRFLLWKLTGRGSPSRAHEVRVQFEQMPDPGNRIRLSGSNDRFGQAEAELCLRVSREQRRDYARALKLAADELGLDGITLVRELDRKFENGDYDFFWHHMGTTRMSDDPAEGVVDRDCRVHGISNLFIAGSSVFPTGGTAAPTLTAVALAVRLADHVLGNARQTAGQVPQDINAERSPRPEEVLVS